jgi:hypothetical protein
MRVWPFPTRISLAFSLTLVGLFYLWREPYHLF